MSAPVKDALDDHDLAIKLLIEERKNLLSDGALIYENVNFFVQVAALLTAANVTLLEVLSFYQGSLSRFIWVPSLLGAVVVLLAWSGWADLSWRNERMLKTVVHIQKIEYRLGIRDRMPGRLAPYPADEFLFEEHDARPGKYSSSKEFISEKLTWFDDGHLRENGYIPMAIVYLAFMCVGAGLIVIPLLIYFFEIA